MQGLKRHLSLCLLLLIAAGALLGILPASAATLKVDPTCAGHGCTGTDAYATQCAGQPFDQEYIVLSAPLEFAGQALGSVQLWYSPLCHTVWARTVAGEPHILLNATLALSSVPASYTRAAWNGDVVISPQAFAPAPVAQASGEILRAGQLASGCVSLVFRGPRACSGTTGPPARAGGQGQSAALSLPLPVPAAMKGKGYMITAHNNADPLLNGEAFLLRNCTSCRSTRPLAPTTPAGMEVWVGE